MFNYLLLTLSPVKVDRDRESGYFSLGHVTGARTLSDKSSPHRHAERGHPLPSNQTPEPKAAIPFRNPDLGVPSQRRTSEIQYPDLAPEALNTSPEPVDLSIEVEAQAGPRSLSPTPFKQAESLAASQKRGFRAQNSSSCQFGNFSSSKQSSAFSHSSSPSRSSPPFKRAETVSSLSSRGYGKDNVSERRDQQSKNLNWSSFGRQSESETVRKNIRTFASTVGAVANLTKPQSSPYADLRAGLRKTEPTSGRGTKTRSPSPARRSHDASGQSLLRKTETKLSNSQKKCESRNSSPSRSSSQSILRKVVEGWRSASPVRKGYGTASQPERTLDSNVWSHNINSSPSRRRIEASSPSLHKSETKTHSPSLRRSYDAPTKQSLLHKTGSDQSSFSQSPSPSKQSYDLPGQSLVHKSERISYSGSNRSFYNRSPSPSKRGYDPPGQSSFRKSESNNYSGSNQSSCSRSPSPSRRGYDPSSQPCIRSMCSSCSKSGQEQSALRKTVSESRMESASYMGKSNNSSTAGSWQGSTHSLHSPPISHNSSPSRKYSEKKLDGVRKSVHVSWSTSDRRQGQDYHSPSCRNRSPVPLMRNHTSSQSSIDSIMSSGSSGLNREEYAIMADLPKVKRVLQRSRPNQMEGTERGNRDEISLYKPARYKTSKHTNKQKSCYMLIQ